MNYIVSEEELNELIGQSQYTNNKIDFLKSKQEVENVYEGEFNECPYYTTLEFKKGENKCSLTKNI